MASAGLVVVSVARVSDNVDLHSNLVTWAVGNPISPVVLERVSIENQKLNEEITLLRRLGFNRRVFNRVIHGWWYCVVGSTDLGTQTFGGGKKKSQGEASWLYTWTSTYCSLT